VAEVQHFAYGWVNPVVAYIMSVLGCLLGIMLATKAQARTGRRRVRLLIYASIAIGGTGVWQAHVIGLLGFAVPDSVVRYDPLPIAASLGIAIVVVGGGLFVAGFGSLHVWRLLVAGALLAEWIGAVDPARFRRAVGQLRTPVTPTGATAAVAAGQSALERNEELAALKLEVRRIGRGVVELRGWVPSRALRARAARAILAVPGIESVVNNVLVRGEDDEPPSAVIPINDRPA